MSNTDPLAARRARSVPVLWPSVSSPPHFTRREVGFSHVRIDLDSVTRLVLDDEISLFPERAFFDDQVRPPTHIVRQLVYTEVAHRCRGVHGRDGADGARGIMRRAPDSVLVGEIGDALRFQQAPQLRDVEVHPVAGLSLDELAEAVASI